MFPFYSVRNIRHLDELEARHQPGWVGMLDAKTGEVRIYLNVI